MADVDPAELKTLNESLAKSEKALQGQIAPLKEQLEAQDAQIKKYGETETKTAATIAKITAKIDTYSEDIKSLTDERDELKERIGEIEKSGQRPGWDGGEGDEIKTPGEIFVGSDQLASALKSKTRETDAVDVKTLFGAIERKASFLSTAATRLVVPQRAEAISPVLRRLRIRDLTPVRATTSDAIEYLEETGFSATSAPVGTKTHGAAAPTEEGATLPEAKLEMELKTANVRDIGHFIPASRQVLMDAGQMRSYIDDRLIFGVIYAEEIQLLYGDGNSPNLLGYLANPLRQQYAWSSGQLLPNPDTKLDAIRRAATLAHVLEYMPTAVVLNPSEWEDIELLKGDDEHYINLVVTTGNEERLFRWPVVITNAINAGQGLIGSFAIAATIWDREQANIRISEHHKDFFTKRLVAILAEERLALTTYRPDAFVDIDFDAAPS